MWNVGRPVALLMLAIGARNMNFSQSARWGSSVAMASAMPASWNAPTIRVTRSEIGPNGSPVVMLVVPLRSSPAPGSTIAAFSMVVPRRQGGAARRKHAGVAGQVQPGAVVAADTAGPHDQDSHRPSRSHGSGPGVDGRVRRYSGVVGAGARWEDTGPGRGRQRARRP